jgi:hypothetical protein
MSLTFAEEVERIPGRFSIRRRFGTTTGERLWGVRAD